MADDESAKLIVTNLPSDHTTELLYDLFGTHGEIVECDCKWGIGFVAFSADEAAEKAFQALNDHVVKGKKIKIDFPGRKEPVQRLIIKNLPPVDFSVEKLLEIFDVHGDIVESEFKWGYGFVRYKQQTSLDDALTAFAECGYMEGDRKLIFEIQSATGEVIKKFQHGKLSLTGTTVKAERDHGEKMDTDTTTSTYNENVGPVRLFVGNLTEETTHEDVREVCEPIGDVKKVDLKGNFAFVHFKSPTVCRDALGLLGKKVINGKTLRVQLAEIKRGGKLFIGNLSEGQDQDELIELFAAHGNIVEFQKVRKFAFMSYDDPADAKKAVTALNGHNLNGVRLKVQLSTSEKGQNSDPDACHGCGMHGHIAKYCPMDKKDTCHKCGGQGHWAKECKGGMNGGSRIRSRSPPYGRGRSPVYDQGYGDGLMGMPSDRPFPGYGRMGR